MNHQQSITDYFAKNLSTKKFGQKNLAYYDEIGSTNDVLKDWVQKGTAEEGAIAIAGHQTHGRGRLGRTWYSPADTGIYLSLLLQPSPVLELNKISTITLVAAVAVYETIQAQFPHAKLAIKWPNDILLDGKKVAGILTELVGSREGTNIESNYKVILGIGINLSFPQEPIPFELVPIMNALQPKEMSPEKIKLDLTSTLLKNLEQRYFEMLDGQLAPIMQKWRKYSNILGKKIRFTSQFGIGQEESGIIQDIANDGSLIVRTQNLDQEDTLIHLISGEIHFEN